MRAGRNTLTRALAAVAALATLAVGGIEAGSAAAKGKELMCGVWEPAVTTAWVLTATKPGLVLQAGAGTVLPRGCDLRACGARRRRARRRSRAFVLVPCRSCQLVHVGQQVLAERLRGGGQTLARAPEQGDGQRVLRD
jgi:hypothetical protein